MRSSSSLPAGARGARRLGACALAGVPVWLAFHACSAPRGGLLRLRVAGALRAVRAGSRACGVWAPASAVAVEFRRACAVLGGEVRAAGSGAPVARCAPVRAVPAVRLWAWRFYVGGAWLGGHWCGPARPSADARLLLGRPEVRSAPVRGARVEVR